MRKKGNSIFNFSNRHLELVLSYTLRSNLRPLSLSSKTWSFYKPGCYYKPEKKVVYRGEASEWKFMHFYEHPPIKSLKIKPFFSVLDINDGTENMGSVYHWPVLVNICVHCTQCTQGCVHNSKQRTFILFSKYCTVLFAVFIDRSTKLDVKKGFIFASDTFSELECSYVWSFEISVRIRM